MRMRLALVIFGLLAGSLPAAAAEAQTCRPWTMRTLVSGLDRVENLEPDGTGGMLISSGPRSAIERLTPDGRRSTFASNVSNPGGLRVRGGTLYAVVGGGNLDAFDLRTGARSVYSGHLDAPNGLVFASGGDAFVSRDLGDVGPFVPNPFHGGIGTNMYIQKVPADDPMHPENRWAALGDTNGLAIDKTNTWLYASTTFNMSAEVFRVRLDDPTVIEKIAELGSVTDPINGLDDMTIGNDGNLYITANGMGRVWQLDPVSGERCIIASGLQNPTSAKFGRGKGWPSSHLFVSAWDGTLRELIPPK
jgi:outer membrane protein assembly factor BamB